MYLRNELKLTYHYILRRITVYPGGLIYTVFVGKWLSLYLGGLKLGRGALKWDFMVSSLSKTITDIVFKKLTL